MASIPSAEALSSASVQMIGRAHESVVQVQSWGRGTGAGVVWDRDGLVLTNHHVVAGGRRGARVQVVLHDDRTFDAQVVRRGRDLDLALLRIEGAPGDLPAAPYGDSDKLRVGGLVYAIGHPWGRLRAVSAGIVSGLGVVRGPGGKARYIQSDVALAPGNSGGPLLDARGAVVGINAMVFGRQALAIPSNAASAWLAGAKEHRPRLGVRILPVELPPFIRRTNPGTPEAGLMVAAIEGGSPAERAGLLVGDVLLGVGDETPYDLESLLDAIASAGDALRLRALRGGKTSFVDVKLGPSGHAA
ncbi:MAG: trypsin-like peptidase domain-containing protein [Actinomycetota bacterium]|nr:trypsin-like peptidase domain-containing protein [Actinomycetota bacterium]